MAIYFVRHGQTDANVVYHGGGVKTDADLGLNEIGRQQILETADKLKNIKFRAIISSPLKRAVESAEIINKYHKLPIIVEEDLRERDCGIIDEEKWAELFNFDNNIDSTESIEDFFTRVYTVIDGIKFNYDMVNEDILVVAHGGVHTCFYAYFNKLPWQGDMRIDKIHNADYRKYDFNEMKK